MDARTSHQTSHYASPGGVRQHGGSLRVSECKRCHAEVAWPTSQRTGRRYMVNVRTGAKGQRFYQGNDLHRCNPLHVRGAWRPAGVYLPEGYGAKLLTGWLRAGVLAEVANA